MDSHKGEHVHTRYTLWSICTHFNTMIQCGHTQYTRYAHCVHTDRHTRVNIHADRCTYTYTYIQWVYTHPRMRGYIHMRIHTYATKRARTICKGMNVHCAVILRGGLYAVLLIYSLHAAVWMGCRHCPYSPPWLRAWGGSRWTVKITATPCCDPSFSGGPAVRMIMDDGCGVCGV